MSSHPSVDESIESTTRACLARLVDQDRPVGAFVDILTDSALSSARALDHNTAAGRPTSPLRGVHVGIKELFDVAGADGSYGSLVLADRRATNDAAVVTALRRAGAVVVGTTRSHEFGWGITTQHATRGSTGNPWNLDRVPGGSSGGSAAAVAAGMVPLAVGSDTGGSIRLPAAFCGVLGLKTTFGRISRTGGVALAPSFDSPGFLARNVTLLAAAFAATTAADPRDPPTVLAPDARPVHLDAVAGLSRLRFAVPAALMPGAIDPERLAAVESMCKALSDLHMQSTDVRLPDARSMIDVFAPLQMAEALDVHTTLLGTYPQRADAYGDDVRSRLELAQSVTVSRYLDARRSQADITAAFARAFQFVDLIITPVGPTGPSLVSSPDNVTVDRTEMPLRAAMMPFTVPQNLAGLPSITCPVGLDDTGMPIGIQITSGPWNEPILLSIAFALERAGVVDVRSPPPSRPVRPQEARP